MAGYHREPRPCSWGRRSALGRCVVDRTRTLTTMECLVLRLSATGMTTAEVAEQLGLAPAEVHRYLSAAIVALRATSKLEAVVLAVRQGLIELR